MKSVTVLFFVLIINFSCRRAVEDKPVPLYFDVPAYIEAEIKRQNAQPGNVEVRWEKDGEIEQKTVQQIDWKKAFDALGKLDLNRAAYRGSYLVDTNIAADRQFIKYQALEASVKPQTLLLVKTREWLERLEITVADENFLYSTHTHYTYVPDDTLRISGTQKVIFGKKHSYKRSYWY